MNTFKSNYGRYDPNARLKRALQEDVDAVKQKARFYINAMQEIARLYDGVKSVGEAAQVTLDTFYVSLDEHGKAYKGSEFLDSVSEHVDTWKINNLRPGNWNVKNMISGESEETTKTGAKKKLMRPRFDRVNRTELKDFRKGKNITPKELQKTFGFAGVTLGGYVLTRHDQDHINYAYDSFMDLANVLGINPIDISLGKTLYMAFGALGRGSKAAAHYSPNHPLRPGSLETVPVINLTNTKGDGSLAHEWFHALDYHLRGVYEYSDIPTNKLVLDVVTLMQVLTAKKFMQSLDRLVQTRNAIFGNVLENILYRS